MGKWFTREVRVGATPPEQGLSTDTAEELTKVSALDWKPTGTLITTSLLVAMVASMGFTASTLAFMVGTGYLKPHAVSPRRMCVPCNTLSITSDPNDDMSSGFERDGDICCSRDSKQTQLIISTVSRVPCLNDLC